MLARFSSLVFGVVLMGCQASRPADPPPRSHPTRAAVIPTASPTATLGLTDAGADAARPPYVYPVMPPGPPRKRAKLTVVVNPEDESFFGRLGIQLIVPPSNSVQVMNRVAAGGSPPPGPLGVDMAGLASYALGGGGIALRDEWSWDETKPRPIAVAFPAENGSFDVVRYAYSRGPLQIEIAQTTYIVAMRFRGLAVDHDLPIERQAEAAANLLLRPAKGRPPFAFGPPLRVGDGYYAERIAPPAKWGSWNDVITFWSDNVDVGFITVKADGKMHQGVESGDEDSNANWFKRFRDDPDESTSKRQLRKR